MTEPVISEPSYSIVRYLKPFPNFEKVYQGKPSTVPIAFPGTLDLNAGKPGYDPNLLAALSVPLGSRVLIWIPLTLSGENVSPVYQYQIVWRLQTVTSFIQGQSTGQVSNEQSYSSYHLGVGPYGQPESLLDPATKRYFLPGAVRTMGFPQTEPSDGAPAVTHLLGQVLQPLASPVWTQPYTPAGGLGTFQQGVYPEPGGNETGPSFMVYSFPAEGDELMILATRINPTDGQTWDFTSSEPGDGSFSETYGDSNGASNASPFTAILVMTGTPQ